MPLPGGEADKLGNRYESRWTVFKMIDVMEEKADSIRLEEPGEDAFEFFISQGDRREYHQVKRQRTGCGSWTLSALESKQVKVLSNFWQILNDLNNTCVFISTQDANELGELANRARDSASLKEFEEKFLNSTQQTKFDKLRQKWGDCSELEAYESLKRVVIETIGDDLLTSIVESRLSALVEGDPRTIRLELEELVLEKIHYELTAYDIWHCLSEVRGYRRREWNQDSGVLSAVEQTNAAYLSTLRESKIDGEVLPRNEVTSILEIIKEGSALVIGEAGTGKSIIISQVLDKLQDSGIPFLAFRIDRLQPTILTDGIGTQLGLPASPPIVLRNIVQNRDCVLVIDQLDAVSLVSGRNPQFFDCISQLIDQAKAHPNIHLILACRKFDLENDNRFKLLTGQDGIAKPVIIPRLSTSSVKEVVTKLGLEASRLNERQLQLLSLPLHLSLLAEITGEISTNILDFETAKDLYDQFWDYKQLKIRERLGHSIQWTQVIDQLCSHMSDRQILSVPASFVDEIAEDTQLMASEHILLWENNRISFFHEGFFDYSYARRFSVGEQTLLGLLRSGEQHLFRRAQVRQILIHQRDIDFNQYLSDIQEILFSSDIRDHLKVIAYSLLATISDPKEEEWKIICPLMTDSSNIYIERSWEILRTSVSWFQLVDSLGLIEEWLCNREKDTIRRTLVLLSLMQSHLPDRVAVIAKSYFNNIDTPYEDISYLLRFVKLEIGHHFFSFFLNLISKGIFDKGKESANLDRDFWMLIYDLHQNKPSWACEAIGRYLNRCLDVCLSQAATNPFDDTKGIFLENSSYQECLYESASREPQSFVVNIFPFIIRTIELNVIQDQDSPLFDSIWRYRTYGNGYEFKENLLDSLEMALSKLASQQSEAFSAFVRESIYNSQFETVQYLLIRAYTANGEDFADEAINYLLEQPQRLQTGYSVCSGNAHAASVWATCLLLESTTPYCSNDNLIKIQNLLLNYYPEWEKEAEYKTLRGYSQFILLNAIDVTRISGSVKQRLQEWRRKFTSAYLLETPGEFGSSESEDDYLIGSPIPVTAAEHMSDEQWLKAIVSYRLDDAGSRFERDGVLVGGARQLAQNLLKEQVKKEPKRFSQLLQRFPETVNIVYFEAVLNGISEVGLDPELALQACKRCHQLPGKPCGTAICRLVQKLADAPWNQEIFSIISWYALNDPDPEQELWRIKSPGGDYYYGGSILTASINSVRGSAASAIAKLIFADKRRTPYFLSILQEMVKDTSISVRSCVAEALIATLKYNRDTAITLFLELCEADSLLMGTRCVEGFLHYGLQTHFDRLQPTVIKILNSDAKSVVQVGARQACLTALYEEQAVPLVEFCLTGTQIHRLAAAEIFVKNLHSAYHREFCKKSLIQLFSDNDSSVRAKAAKCFSHMGQRLDDYVSLIDQFVETPAFFEGCHDLISSLEKTTSKLPKSTYRICERFIQNITGKGAQNSSRSITLVNQILVRLYSQNSRDLDFQSQCLDLLDQMIKIGIFGLEQSLAPFER